MSTWELTQRTLSNSVQSLPLSWCTAQDGVSGLILIDFLIWTNFTNNWSRRTETLLLIAIGFNLFQISFMGYNLLLWISFHWEIMVFWYLARLTTGAWRQNLFTWTFTPAWWLSRRGFVGSQLWLYYRSRCYSLLSKVRSK